MGTNRKPLNRQQEPVTAFSGFELQPWPTWIVIRKSIKFISIRVSGLGQSCIFHGRKTDYNNSHLRTDCANKTFHSGILGIWLEKGKMNTPFY